jgi:hypothetical protein
MDYIIDIPSPIKTRTTELLDAVHWASETDAKLSRSFVFLFVISLYFSWDVSLYIQLQIKWALKFQWQETLFLFYKNDKWY